MTVQLKTFRFDGHTAGKHLLITGGVHGDEFEPMAAIRRLIEEFRTNASLLSQLQGRVTLVPIVNESAFLRGHRCGDDGLDLARTCPGDHHGSVTQQTAFALSALIRESDYYIDLHTGGTELKVYPLAGYVLHRNPAVLEIQRRMARAFNLPLVWGTAGDLDGRSLSVARDAEVPAIYCEFSGAAVCDPVGVDAYVAGCWNVLNELGMLARNLPPNRVETVREDPTPGSGHMQVCNPSPVTGFFEPSQSLGNRVEAGAALGIVYDVDDGQPHLVTTKVAGIVAVLRTFPRVHQGDSLAVVIESQS
jgi:predicted deacylase